MIDAGQDGSVGVQTLRDAGVAVGAGVRAWLGPEVQVGAGVRIGDGAVLVADKLELGDGVSIGAQADLRSSRLRVGARSEVMAEVRVLVADEFAMQEAGRIESGVSIVCRSFLAGRLLYLGHDSAVGYGGTMASSSAVTLGHRVALGPHSILNANLPIVLDDQVGSGAYLSIWTHGYHFGHRLLDGYGATFSGVHVERNVWLGYHATVLPGVRIGQNTILAAGAVVARDLPADVLAAGVPAVVKKALAPIRPADAVAHARVAELLMEWAQELHWKQIPVTRDPAGWVVGLHHRVHLLGPGAETPAPVGEYRQILLTLGDRPDLRSMPGDRRVLFELSLGEVSGELDEVAHDLRDFLRRNALPCGDQDCFRGLPAEPFERLRAIGN